MGCGWSDKTKVILNSTQFKFKLKLKLELSLAIKPSKNNLTKNKIKNKVQYKFWAKTNC